MIAVVDYGRGNLFSLGQAFRHIGAEFEITSDAERVRKARKLVLPGVGAFGDCMRRLRQLGLDAAIQAAGDQGATILGICVGCQVLLDTGEEHYVEKGLGLVAGSVRRLPGPSAGKGTTRIPNVGWRPINFRLQDRLLRVLPPDAMMYFTHSYAPVPVDPGNGSAWVSINGFEAVAAISHQRIFGVQFHPEKSGPVGHRLLHRFVELD